MQLEKVSRALGLAQSLETCKEQGVSEIAGEIAELLEAVRAEMLRLEDSYRSGAYE